MAGKSTVPRSLGYLRFGMGYLPPAGILLAQ
jgi:hypothetical protein